MAALVDTNVLVYAFDPRFPDKQRQARALLRLGIQQGHLRIPHQALIEFFAAVTRPLRGQPPLLDPLDACREVEELMTLFPILFPTEEIVRTALRGALTYGLSWFDAHLWAYAEHFGLEQIFSEDFQAGRTYGTVRVVNPFQVGQDCTSAVR